VIGATRVALNHMLSAAGWGFVTAMSLLLGAGLAVVFKPTRPVIGAIMAFGAGALISAVSFELVGEALESDRAGLVALGLGAGSLAFFVGDGVIEKKGGGGRKRSGGEQASGSALAIFLGTVLDGLPESFILGLAVARDDPVSVAFVGAVFISNLPEAMAGTHGLLRARWPFVRIMTMWAAVVLAAVVSAALGFVFFDSNPGAEGAFVQGFAAGALLTMLANTMMPEAFEYEGRWVGIFTVGGFAVAVALSELG
jgi:zinc transporter, ZIP family